ncbi:MAG: hypothetical protein EOM83_03755 [Clostridia bacterium]|nr:hypothetical protein [Clostridia bacterium]
MKNSTTIIMLLALALTIVSACKKSDDNDDDNNNKLPDAVFSMNVSGAESQTVNFTLPGNVASGNAINGALLSSQELFTMNASPLPITWMLGLAAELSAIETGTYNLKPGVSAYTSPSQTTGYIAVSGTITISKAELYQGVSSIKDWFIDGSYTGTFQDTSTPPNQITISGSFSGINIKAQ